MRLLVKQDGRTVNEFKAAEGPVYIGRRPDNQITLPDGAVSKQHAVIFATDDGKWMVEDLDSANKTYLNDRAIHKAEIETGDCLRIADFTIEVNLENDTGAGGATDLEDTLTATARGPQIIIRKPGAEKAPAVRFPAERAVDFLQATDAISRAGGVDEVLLVLLDIVAKQFGAYHFWCALRDEPAGAMTAHAGRKRDGRAVQLNKLEINEKINEAIEKQEFLLFLFSRIMEQAKHEQIRSVLIAPVISASGCFGVVYANNTFRDEHYNLGDLDYLMLLAIHTATVLEGL